MKITDEKILKQLIDIRNNGYSKQERTRSGAILLSNNDIHLNDISKIFNVTTRSVFGWFKDFRDEGIESLKCKSGRGRKLLLNADKHKGIIEKHMANHPHQPKTAFALTVDETGVKMSYDTFKLFLKKNSISATRE
jgi:transposase